ncbi:MAG: hypothetical protein QXW97_04470 [Candidatus Pacearchaeota archaeon]
MVKSKKTIKSRKEKFHKNKIKPFEIVEGVLILILTFLIIFFASFFNPNVSAFICLIFLIILIFYVIIRYKMKKKSK